MATRLSHGLLGALAAALVAAAPAGARDARALTDEGQVLTVGGWRLEAADGEDLRVADDRSLGWELRDEDGLLLAQGEVPGSDGLGLDASPALARSPLTGDVWLAWSRQAEPGATAEVVLQRFTAGGWVAESLRTLASDVDDQLDPSIVVDEGGTAWVAWIGGAMTRTVRFAGVRADGSILGVRDLSSGSSEWNGRPTLGIDAVGRIFVAAAGTPVTGGDVTLFVWTPNSRPVGASPIPDPFLELGLRGAVPAPSLGRTPAAPLPVPSQVQLTVLGGTPVAWWTEAENGRDVRFKYAAETSSGWQEAQLRTIDLRAGMVATVPEALALIEARLRRVVDSVPGGPATPVVPPVGGGGGFGRLQVRR